MSKRQIENNSSVQPAKKILLEKMKIDVKVISGLKAGSSCTVQVSEKSNVTYLKDLVATELQVDAKDMRLVFKGKNLQDSKDLGEYNIIDGTRLMAIIKANCISDASTSSYELQNPQQFDDSLMNVLKKHFLEKDAEKVCETFKKNILITVNALSLDDIEYLAKINLEKKENLNNINNGN